MRYPNMPMTAAQRREATIDRLRLAVESALERVEETAQMVGESAGMGFITPPSTLAKLSKAKAAHTRALNDLCQALTNMETSSTEGNFPPEVWYEGRLFKPMQPIRPCVGGRAEYVRDDGGDTIWVNGKTGRVSESFPCSQCCVREKETE